MQSGLYLYCVAHAYTEPCYQNILSVMIKLFLIMVLCPGRRQAANRTKQGRDTKDREDTEDREDAEDRENTVGTKEKHATQRAGRSSEEEAARGNTNHDNISVVDIE